LEGIPQKETKILVKKGELIMEKDENIKAFEQMVDLIAANAKRDIPAYFTVVKTVTETKTVIKYAFPGKDKT